MAEVMIIRNTYGGSEYVRNAVNYVLDERAVHKGGFGVNTYNSTDVYNQFMAVKNYYQKEDFNPLVHFVVAFGKGVDTKEKAVFCTYMIAQYFSSEYQVIYCIHKKDAGNSSYHAHIIVNSVSYRDGYMMETGWYEMNKVCELVSKVTHENTHFIFKNKNTEANK